MWRHSSRFGEFGFWKNKKENKKKKKKKQKNVSKFLRGIGQLGHGFYLVIRRIAAITAV